MCGTATVFAFLARLTVYFAPTIQIMIDGTVYYMVVFRSSAYTGASLWVLVQLKSMLGIPRSLSNSPLTLAAVLVAVIWSGKTKVKRNKMKSSEYHSMWLSVTGVVYAVLWCVRDFLLRMIDLSWRSTGGMTASKGEVKRFIQLTRKCD